MIASLAALLGSVNVGPSGGGTSSGNFSSAEIRVFFFLYFPLIAPTSKHFRHNPLRAFADRFKQ